MYIKYLVQYAFTFIYFINNNCLRRKSFAPIAVPRAQVIEMFISFWIYLFFFS